MNHEFKMDIETAHVMCNANYHSPDETIIHSGTYFTAHTVKTFMIEQLPGLVT